MNDTQKAEPHLETWRLYFVYGLVILLFLYYASRLFNLQVLEGADYVARAEENRTTRVSDTTQRGIIYDRNGIVLARNVASYNVTITPAYLPEVLPITYEEVVPGPDQEIYRKLSDLLGIPVSAGAAPGEDGAMTLTDEIVRVFKPCETDLGIKEIVYIQDTTAPYDPVRLVCNIDPDIAMQIREQSADMPGVNIEIEPVRDYPTGELTAEIIGFLGPVPANQEQYYREKGFLPGRDKVGYAGIENSLQDILGGRNGERYVEVDVAGRELRNLAEPIKPVAGNNVRLSLDLRLQQAARAALVYEINWWNTYFNRIQSNQGVVVAMNVKTGEILAMVSYPSYENNRFAKLIPSYYYNQLSVDPAKPLLNKAISGAYPPGSVFKMPTAIGALNEGVVAPDQLVFDPGKITLEEKPLPNSPATNTREYVCWNENGHGDMDWLRGVMNSCDVYFYKIGGGFRDEVPNGGLGIWRLGEYSRALGYGAISGIELPGEDEGLIPDPTWKRKYQNESWTTGDTYIASMGQGLILSTPLQVLLSAAVLANDGKFMRPTLIREVLDSEGNVIKPFEPDLKWDITVDPKIQIYEDNIGTLEYKTVDKWVVQMAKQAMRLVVTEGTAVRPMQEELALETRNPPILTAGKTGTAEYCDDVANKAGRCKFGQWPAHSWYFGYAPYDNPEIAVVAFVYNGGEGASVAAPVVGKVIEAYYNLKAIDAQKGAPAGEP